MAGRAVFVLRSIELSGSYKNNRPQQRTSDRTQNWLEFLQVYIDFKKCVCGTQMLSRARLCRGGASVAHTPLEKVVYRKYGKLKCCSIATAVTTVLLISPILVDRPHGKTPSQAFALPRYVPLF
jgi:hypothetical protein